MKIFAVRCLIRAPVKCTSSSRGRSIAVIRFCWEDYSRILNVYPQLTTSRSETLFLLLRLPNHGWAVIIILCLRLRRLCCVASTNVSVLCPTLPRPNSHVAVQPSFRPAVDSCSRSMWSVSGGRLPQSLLWQIQHDVPLPACCIVVLSRITSNVCVVVFVLA